MPETIIATVTEPKRTRLASAAEIALSNPGIFAAAKHFGSRA